MLFEWTVNFPPLPLTFRVLLCKWSLRTLWVGKFFSVKNLKYFLLLHLTLLHIVPHIFNLLSQLLYVGFRRLSIVTDFLDFYCFRVHFGLQNCPDLFLLYILVLGFFLKSILDAADGRDAEGLAVGNFFHSVDSGFDGFGFSDVLTEVIPFEIDLEIDEVFNNLSHPFEDGMKISFISFFIFLLFF